MGNYSNQYKSYYECLKNKNVKIRKSASYNSENFISAYGGVNKPKGKKSFFDSMINVFIYQLVVVVLMIMTMFFLKYNPGKETAQSYNNIKAVLNDTTYSINDENSEDNIDISSVWKKVNNYIKSKMNWDKINL